MSEEIPPAQPTNVNTSGGAFVGESVSTNGGDFIGRDKITFQTTNNYIVKDYREEHYRVALNWDGKTRMRAFDLSRRDLSKLKLIQSDFIECNFEYANLTYTVLRGANLSKSNLHQANLTATDMREANLSDAKILWIQLAKVKRLRKAIMPDKKYYDGRLNLRHDVADCITSFSWGAVGFSHFFALIDCIIIAWNFYWFIAQGKVTLGLYEHAAKFYGVSLQDFEMGQQWAHTNNTPTFLAASRRLFGLREKILVIIIILAIAVISLFSLYKRFSY